MNHWTRRGALTLGAALIAAPAAWAQAWPSKPIRLIVPYAAGGGTDLFARSLATELTGRLGQQVIVENKPGAGTVIGAQEVARSAPDGHTLLLGDSATFAVNPSLYQKLPYDPLRDFAPITLTGRFSLLLVVNPAKLEVGSLSDLLKVMKQRPGDIPYGSPGTGSPHHLAMELLAQHVGAKLSHIPYKGSSPALNDLLGGQIPLMFVNLATAAPHVKAGKLKVLAVSGDKRVAALPDVPTVAQAGVPGYEAWAWQGLVAPAGVPSAIVQRLNAEYERTVGDPAFRQKMIDDAGIEPMQSTGAQMRDYMMAEMAKWAKVVKDAGIKAN